MGDLIASRQTFVPAGGRFVRVIDVIENTGTEAVDLELYMEQAHAAADPWTVVTTSSGDETYDGLDDYVVMTHADASSPEMAFVTAGAGAGVARGGAYGTAREALDGWTLFFDNQLLTLAPGERALSVRFAVQRPHGDVAGALDQAVALFDLTDPEALAGLSQADRDAIVNFVVTP
jgi:hypothetical protein